MLTINVSSHNTNSADDIVTLSWILRCFLGTIREHYVPGSPRSIEADAIVTDIVLQVRGQIPSDEYAEFITEISNYLEKSA